MRYRPEIDGLRALAVVPVILFHAGYELFNGGFVGVDVFFVISGYLITSIILREKDEGRFSLFQFYERRARRILPALFFVTAVSMLVGFFLFSPTQLKYFSDSALATSTYWSNIYFWRNANYFSESSGLLPLLHTWSLSIEEQYYLIYPLTLLIFWRFGKTNLVVILAVAFVLSLGIAQWGSSNYPYAAFYVLPARGWELLAGAFIAFYLHKKIGDQPPNFVAQSASLLGLVLIAISVFAFDSGTPFPSLYTLAPTIGTALVILFAIKGTIASTLLKNRALVGVGLVSYSAYLWHQPVLAFGRHLSLESSNPAFAISAATLVLGLSVASYRYIETPFRNKLTIRTRTLWLAVVISVLALSLTTVTIRSNDGFINRFPSSTHKLLGDMDRSSDYIPHRFDSLPTRQFKDELPFRKKVALVGDSYAMDLVNALGERGELQSLNISVHHISARCGNLYLDYSIEDAIAAENKIRCVREGWYTDDAVEMIREADEIWLASNWSEWHLSYLEESLRNIERDFSGRVVLFGTKVFWEENKPFAKILDIYKNAEPVRVPGTTRSINSEMSGITSSTNVTFVDLLSLLCDEPLCDLRTSQSDSLITVDGGHLTQGGAQKLGDRLPASIFR